MPNRNIIKEFKNLNYSKNLIKLIIKINEIKCLRYSSTSSAYYSNSLDLSAFLSHLADSTLMQFNALLYIWYFYCSFFIRFSLMEIKMGNWTKFWFVCFYATSSQALLSTCPPLNVACETLPLPLPLRNITENIHLLYSHLFLYFLPYLFSVLLHVFVVAATLENQCILLI